MVELMTSSGASEGAVTPGGARHLAGGILDLSIPALVALPLGVVGAAGRHNEAGPGRCRLRVVPAFLQDGPTTASTTIVATATAVAPRLDGSAAAVGRVGKATRGIGGTASRSATSCRSGSGPSRSPSQASLPRARGTRSRPAVLRRAVRGGMTLPVRQSSVGDLALTELLVVPQHGSPLAAAVAATPRAATARAGPCPEPPVRGSGGCRSTVRTCVTSAAVPRCRGWSSCGAGTPPGGRPG